MHVPAWAAWTAGLALAILLVGLLLGAVGSLKRNEAIGLDYRDAKRTEIYQDSADWIVVGSLLSKLGRLGLAGAMLLTGFAVPNPRFARILLVVVGALLLGSNAFSLGYYGTSSSLSTGAATEGDF